MEAPEQFQQGRPLPNTFRRGLDALVLSYRGYETDLVDAYNAINTGNKSEFLKLFRKIKSKQVSHEHRQETKESARWIAKELKYPGNEADKQKLQKFFLENPPTQQNVKIFKEQIEGLRNKNAAVRGDRSHPNIAALLKLKLTYPGCEKDVKEALEVHYSRPLTQFPNQLHSLKMKQLLYDGDRSHWRLLELDGLKTDLSYPRWKRDIDAAEDWHVHNIESRENDIFFHDIMEGILEKQALYLEWVLQRRRPKTISVEKSKEENAIDDILTAIEDYEGENSKFDKYYVDERKTVEKSFPPKEIRLVDEQREPVVHCERS